MPINRTKRAPEDSGRSLCLPYFLSSLAELGTILLCCSHFPDPASLACLGALTFTPHGLILVSKCSYPSSHTSFHRPCGLPLK